jgi:CDP-paratose 2-epimerase
MEGATCYTREPATIDEDARTLGGSLTPLHASKAAAEHYVRVYADSYRVRAAAFRFTGLYGPRQFGGEDHGWVANFCIRNVIGLPLTVYGTGKQVRDILYASDAAQAVLDVYRQGAPGIYNVGGGPATAVSLLECIELIDAITGRRSDVRFGPPRFGDLQYFVCDITRAERALGWRPRATVREGLAALIQWIETARKVFTLREGALS